MLAADLVLGVAEGRAEVLVRGQHAAIETELDDGLHLVDRRELAGGVGGLDLGGGDVGRVLDDLERLAVRSEDRVVAGLYPDIAPALGDALVLAGVEFAATELVPEQPVLGRAALRRVDEQAVMLAADLLERIA